MVYDKLGLLENEGFKNHHKVEKNGNFQPFLVRNIFFAFIENLLISNCVQYSYSSLFFIKANECRKQSCSTKKLYKIYKPHP